MAHLRFAPGVCEDLHGLGRAGLAVFEYFECLLNDPPPEPDWFYATANSEYNYICFKRIRRCHHHLCQTIPKFRRYAESLAPAL